MASSSTNRGLPTWALGIAVAVLVLVAGIVVWKSVSANSIDLRAQKTIQPGAYDFKQEIDKMQARDKTKAENEKPMGGF